MPKKRKVTVLYVPVGEAPRVVEVDGSLEGYQKLVSGDIEPMHPFEDSDVVLVCNEEGKLIPLTANRVLWDERNPKRALDIVFGNFFLVYSPENAESFQSLPAELIPKYEAMFHSPEYIIQPEKGKIVAVPFDPVQAGTDEAAKQQPRGS